ncbi:MAG: hypothetical protein ACRDTE_13185 [Pseudonocardiaceae bacterium]
MTDRSSGRAGRQMLPSAIPLLLAEAPSHGYALDERLAALGQQALPARSVYREARRLEAEGRLVGVGAVRRARTPSHL